jgi:serine/threonine protein kinase
VYVQVPYTSLRGTVGYIAPEILRESSYGIASDMWSAGIIMYELISGMKPFVPYSECLESPPDFPDMVWKSKSVLGVNMIKRMLELDPDDRLTAKEALQEPWIHIFASC